MNFALDALDAFAVDTEAAIEYIESLFTIFEPVDCGVAFES